MLKKSLSVLSLFLLLNACSSTKEPISAATSSTTEQSTQTNTSLQEGSLDNSSANPKLTDNSLSTSKNTVEGSVYFDFDKYNIKAQYQNLLKDNAQKIVTDSASVRIEGNTDDVGSTEYNIALGQRRAAAVENALVAEGVDKSKIEAVSNGSTKPLDASDKAKNRRADIIFGNK